MEAQKIAVDAVVALDRLRPRRRHRFIRRLYLAGVTDSQAPDLQGSPGVVAGVIRARFGRFQLGSRTALSSE